MAKNLTINSPEETQQRMVAALRGAQLAGHVPMKAKKAVKKTNRRRSPASEPGLNRSLTRKT
jgi:hypothetical protein